MTELGDTLRAAREARGMTQVALAAYFGISKSAVNQWESGKNIPDQRKIAALAEKLELDPALLVRLAGIRRAGRGAGGGDEPGADPARPARHPGVGERRGRQRRRDGAGQRPDRLDPPPRAHAGRQGAVRLLRDRHLDEPGDRARRPGGGEPEPAAAAGKDHVFLQTQEDGTILALVKRLLRVGATSWKVRQFNPPKDFDLPKAKWGKALMITEKRVG
jgi:transcriptional regulator with XRE-family HTH domain